jgi:hypothetical protein
VCRFSGKKGKTEKRIFHAEKKYFLSFYFTISKLRSTLSHVKRKEKKAARKKNTEEENEEERKRKTSC